MLMDDNDDGDDLDQQDVEEDELEEGCDGCDDEGAMQDNDGEGEGDGDLSEDFDGADDAARSARDNRPQGQLQRQKTSTIKP